MRIISFFILLFISSTSFAGTYDEDLKELFDLAGVRNHYTNLNTFMLSQMQTGFFQEANQKFDVSEYTEAQRKQIGEILKNRFSQMVEDYTSFVSTFISYEKVSDEVYLSLYKEFYTHDEVKQLLAFYKTDIGQKSLKSAAKISEMANKKAADKYNDRFSDYMATQISENIQLVEQEISSKVLK